ncbi:MAG: hypothetical protein V4722_09615 [Bacteroidota bacterium]
MKLHFLDLPGNDLVFIIIAISVLLYFTVPEILKYFRKNPK